jgi:dipeptide/tripeptide permease
MTATQSLSVYTNVFTKIAWVAAACGVLLLILSPWLKKMMSDKKLYGQKQDK